MSIGKKLFYGFNGVIALVFLLALVNFAALMRTRTAKENTARSIQVLDAISQVKLQMSANRLSLGNYLLSGSPDDARKIEEGVAALQTRLRAAEKVAPEQGSYLERAATAEDHAESSRTAAGERLTAALARTPAPPTPTASIRGRAAP